MLGTLKSLDPRGSWRSLPSPGSHLAKLLRLLHLLRWDLARGVIRSGVEAV